MGGYQNYGPFLGTLNIRGRIIIGIQKGTIILTTNHMHLKPSYSLLARNQFDSDSQVLSNPETIDCLYDHVFEQPRQSSLLRGTIPRPAERNNKCQKGYGITKALAGMDPRICKRRLELNCRHLYAKP